MSDQKKSLEKRSELDMTEFNQFGRDREHLLQKIQELRVEIDNLRLQNQKLHMELDRFLDLRHLIRRTVKTGWLETIHKIHHIKSKFVRKSHIKNDNYNSSFKPHKVQILHPIQPNRPRVLHAIGNFYIGGSARLVVDLIEHLGHRFEQEVITRDNPVTPGYIGLKLYHYKRFLNPHQVLAHLKKFMPHIIHVHFLGHHKDRYSELDWKWYNNVFQAAEEYGCKVIENINIPVEPYVSDSVSYYVYVSDHVRHEFGRLDGRNITIYPGSNFNFFTRKDQVDIPDDCIGMVYRLDRDKLNEHSIDVFIKVIQRRKVTKALIVGGSYYLEIYRNIVQQAGVDDAFTFTGFVSYEELPSLFQKMSIFVAPVHTESFGQVSPFAMNMGIPVVGYNVGALEEIIADRKLLAPPGDSDTLANIIIELLDDRERRLRIGSMNRQRAQQLFSVEAMINRYSALYDEMIKSDQG
jgi:glycosyltransferase involved in cell wall biosynthesis